jgi:hypothetical protein
LLLACAKSLAKLFAPIQTVLLAWLVLTIALLVKEAMTWTIEGSVLIVQTDMAFIITQLLVNVKHANKASVLLVTSTNATFVTNTTA